MHCIFFIKHLSNKTVLVSLFALHTCNLKENPDLHLLAGESFIEEEYTQQSLGELGGDSGVQELSWGEDLPQAL